MSSPTSKIGSSEPPPPVQPPADARERMARVLKWVVYINWVTLFLFLLMFRGTTFRHDWSNECERVLGGKTLLIQMQLLSFGPLLLSFIATLALKGFVDLSSGVAGKELVWVRLGVAFCLTTSWLALFAVIMLLQVTVANTFDCVNKGSYNLSVGVISFIQLCVLICYAGLGFHAW